jgi:hypothetical protein
LPSATRRPAFSGDTHRLKAMSGTLNGAIALMLLDLLAA